MSDETTNQSSLPVPQNFEEFWPYYVTQHQNKTSRQCHFIGTTIAMGCLAATPFYPPAFLAAPVAGYGMAWIGHFVFEKNKPATWGGAKFAAWSLRGDFRMWRKMLVGKMDAEVERVLATYGRERTTNGANGHANGDHPQYA